MALGELVVRFLKAIRDYYPEELEVVAFNDIGDMKTMAHLLKYDLTYGRFNGTVEIHEDGLLIDGKKVKVFKETDPSAIRGEDLGIDIVIELTGLFTIKEDGVNKKGKTVKGAVNHITKGGAKKVIISAPGGRRRPDRSVGRQRRQVRPEDPQRGLERLLHHELPGPGGESRA